MSALKVSRNKPVRRLSCRATACALSIVVLAASAASGHAGIPNSPSFGNQPNPRGGTGLAGATPPYAPNSAVTIVLRAADEVSAPFNGLDDSNVEVKVRIPAPWTAPACVTGGAQLTKNDASTNNTNQPGAAAAGWSCEVIDTTEPSTTVHKVVRFSGPASTLATDHSGAEFFSFKVTTPAPVTTTLYDGLNGTEGFFATQSYVSGASRYWFPADGATAPDFPKPAAAPNSTAAGGLRRTVAAVGSPAVPSGSPVAQTLTVTVPESSEFSLTIPGSNPAVVLGAAAPNASYLQFTGTMNPVILSDSRASKPAWSVSGQVSNFGPPANTIDGKHLGWTPTVVTAGAGASAGPNIPSGIGGAATDGLRTARTLASAAANHELGSATLGANLDLRLPLGTPAGTYTATLTLTAI